MKDKLTKHILDLGACDVGFSYCEDAPSPFKNAVTIVAKLSDAVIDEIDTAPTHSYFHHYRTVNTFLDQAVLKAGILLEQNGYKYLPVAASQSINIGGNNYCGRYSHKKAACLAGLGTIGKNSLFLHRKFGPRVRLATLFTDCDFGVENHHPRSVCGSCNICASACPAMAILGGEWSENITRAEIYDAKACSDYMKEKFKHIGRGAVCGICMRVCPARDLKL